MISFTELDQVLDYISKHQTNIVQTDVHTTKEMFYNSYGNRINSIFQFGEVKAKLIHIDYMEYSTPPFGILRWELPYDIKLERKVDLKA